MSNAHYANSSGSDGHCAVGASRQVLEFVPLSEAARSLVAANINGADLMNRLLEADLEVDAITLTPFLLPIRQAVWWGCLNAWHACGSDPAALEDDALGAAVRWVRTPTQVEGQMAEKAALADECNSPGSCCAMAAGWAGFQNPSGTWVHRDVPVAARLIAGAVLLCLGKPNGKGLKRRQTLGWAIDVAQGSNRWQKDGSR